MTIRKILFVLLLVGLHSIGHAACVVGDGPPGSRQCTDAELSPAAEMMANASLFAEAIQSVGHVCDRVEAVYRDDAPGINYYHVTCTGQLRYTVGVSKARVVVWAGNFTNY